MPIASQLFQALILVYSSVVEESSAQAVDETEPALTETRKAYSPLSPTQLGLFHPWY
jgi:hypothetical protein